jgi:hypothetical protein
MQYEISDRAAVELARTFYDSLADGEGVDAAVTESRQAIKMALGETVEWGTPVLHMRAKSGSLFRVDLQEAIGINLAPAPQVQAPAAAAPGAAEVQRLQILLRKVRQLWVDGALAQSGERSARLEPGLETMAGAVSSPWETAAPDGSAPVPGRSIAESFEDMGGSLLILGEPGSGKTMTLLELARDLLARTEADTSRPVPVVFPLSSWIDPKRRLADWLADELVAKYQIPKKFGQSWVQERRLLPLLDGLDEVRPEIRAACVEAINAFTQELLTGAVICCRLKEYLELPVRLALNGAVRVLPLSREQVLAFLAAAGERLAALHNLLQRDPAMLMDARSPLMLGLMVQAYQNLPAGALDTESADSLAARRRKVMESYVARMFNRAGGSHV